MLWTSWSIPGLVTGAVAMIGALVVVRTDPGRRLNRRLALLLLLEGVYIGCCVGLMFLVTNGRVAHVVSVVGIACFGALPFQYLSFLGASLKTPLVSPFRTRIADVGLGITTLGVVTWILLRPDSFVSEPYSPDWAAWNFQMTGLGVRLTQLHGVASAFGLVAALHAFYRAPAGSAARDTAKWFAFAFGTRDAYVGVLHTLYESVRPISFWGDFLYNPGQGLAYLAYVSLLSYGVLRVQMFDLDLKIKWALVRSVVVSAIAGAFFVGSEALESIIPVEGTILGLLFAGLVVVALKPVQRVSESLVGVLMPGVESTPSYVDGRKAEVFGATYEVAIIDGIISEEERIILDRLADQLSIAAKERAAIERAVSARLRGNGD